MADKTFTLNADLNVNGDVSLDNNLNFDYGTDKGGISSTSQSFKLKASSESNYHVVLGVQDGVWALAPLTSGYLQLGTTNHRFTKVYMGSNLYFNNNGSISNTANQNLTLKASTETNYGVKFGVTSNAWAFCPTTTNNTALGGASNLWTTVYAKNRSISTSDRNLKENIKDIDDKYIQLFNNIKPVSYKLIDGDRTHLGYIAQDVEDSMSQAGLTPIDFAGLCKDKIYETIYDEDGNEVGEQETDEYRYGLRYEEFIPIHTLMIQKLQQTVETLQTQVSELKQEISKLKQGDIATNE